MQRGESSERIARKRLAKVMRTRNNVAPWPSRPAVMPNLVVYGVRMRNTRTPRQAWAEYSAAARQAAKLSASELARRLGIDRVTVWRWENGKQKPENSEVVQKFAEATGVDLDEALAAAGLRPGAVAPKEPTQEPPMDPDLVTLMAKLADPNVNDETKAFIRQTLQHLANLPENPPKKRPKAV